jgi:Zn-dependent protease
MQFLEGLRRQRVLGHVSGIPVRADLRWFFVLIILSTIIAASLQPFVLHWPSSIAIGSATALVFFLSIFLHEFAHAGVARMEGLRVVEIVLHPFGGLTRFAHEPETPRAEFRIAIAGPAASFLLAVFFAIVMAIGSAAEASVLVIVAFTLAIGNFLLAVFNMFPGYPLDGGRVLRAYLWHSGRDLNEATVLTGRCGQAIAIVLMVFGVGIAVFRQDFFTGFWALLVGIFLFDSARGIIAEVRQLERVAVEDVMMLPISLEPDTTIHEVVERILPMYRQPVFPVARNKRLEGTLLLTEMKRIGPEKWRETRVGDIMRPVEPDHFVETGDPLTEAREVMLRNGIGAVSVIDLSGRLVGFLHGSGSRK